MTWPTRLTPRPRMGLMSIGTAAVLSLASVGAWMNMGSRMPPNGVYQSRGEVQLGNGAIIGVSNELRIDAGHFRATTRQGNTVLETYGTVEAGRRGLYLLRVEDGNVSGLAADPAYDEFAFNLLYGRYRDSTIHLHSIDNCLYALETRHLYCAGSTAGGR